MCVQLDNNFKLLAYALRYRPVDYSVYEGEKKIRYQENFLGKLCSHCRFVLFVFAALFDIAIVRSNTMKKFFTLLFANILLINIGCVPQLGRLYAYPIYRFFTGYGYENEWFCNPLWCFIAEWPLVFDHRSGYLASFISMGFTLWLLPPVITVAFYFYCDWKNKWTWFIYGVFVIICLFSMPIPIETGRAFPFIYWSTY